MIFQEKYSINCPQVFIWLPLILEILGNMCTVITCFPPPPPPLVDEVIRVFQGERRSIILKLTSVAKNYLFLLFDGIFSLRY